MQKRKIFGEIGFFANTPRSASAKCEDFVNLFILRRSKFVKLLENRHVFIFKNY